MDFASSLLDKLVLVLMHDGRTVLVRLSSLQSVQLLQGFLRQVISAQLAAKINFLLRACLQGVLKGVDMQTTLVLSECRERIFSESGGVEEVALGLYIVRGDQLCVLAEVDEEADAAVDWAATRGSKPEPILVGVL